MTSQKQGLCITWKLKTTKVHLGVACPEAPTFQANLGFNEDVLSPVQTRPTCWSKIVLFKIFVQHIVQHF